MYMNLSIYLSCIYLSYYSLSIYVSFYLFVYQYIQLSMYFWIFFYLSIYLSIYLYIYLSIYLSLLSIYLTLGAPERDRLQLDGLAELLPPPHLLIYIKRGTAVVREKLCLYFEFTATHLSRLLRGGGGDKILNILKKSCTLCIAGQTLFLLFQKYSLLFSNIHLL